MSGNKALKYTFHNDPYTFYANQIQTGKPSHEMTMNSNHIALDLKWLSNGFTNAVENL